MKQLFKIDESEKKRILEMHENATKKNYLSEQDQAPAATTQTALQREPFTSTSGVKYKLPAIQSDENLATFTDAEKYDRYVSFKKEPGLGDDGISHIGFYVIALLDLIAQNATENQQVCNKEIGGLIDDAMMGAAYEKYKQRATILENGPLLLKTIYKYASGISQSQNSTDDDKVRFGKDEIKRAIMRLAQTNIKNIPNACQA
jgi:hypothetical protein